MIDKYLIADIIDKDVLSASMEDDEIEVDLSDILVVGNALPKYEGEYTIKPKFKNQILETKEKRMTENMVIEQISVVKTSNTSGGNTVIIGG